MNTPHSTIRACLARSIAVTCTVMPFSCWNDEEGEALYLLQPAHKATACIMMTVTSFKYHVCTCDTLQSSWYIDKAMPGKQSVLLSFCDVYAIDAWVMVGFVSFCTNSCSSLQYQNQSDELQLFVQKDTTIVQLLLAALLSCSGSRPCNACAATK